MTTYVGLLNVLALTLISILAFPSFAEENEIALPGDRAYPESISAASNGTLYVGSLATGGVWRIKPQAGAVEEWIKPGAFGSRSILGVLVDEKANLLWVCSNDFSSSEIPGPSSVPGSFVNGLICQPAKARSVRSFRVRRRSATAMMDANMRRPLGGAKAAQLHIDHLPLRFTRSIKRYGMLLVSIPTAG